jgi:transposase-like protein
MIKAESTVTTMTCTECDVLCQRFGTHRNGLQRFVARSARSLHRTAQAPNRGYEPRRRKGLLALQLFVEGNSLRSTERITGVDIKYPHEALGEGGREVRKTHGPDDW